MIFLLSSVANDCYNTIPKLLALNFDAPEIEKMLSQGASGLDVCQVTRDGTPDWHADIVLTPMRGNVELTSLLRHCCGLRWMHVLGTGVDDFPFELAGDRLITCSRGATAVPIAEWVMAMMLSFEKRHPRVRLSPHVAWSGPRVVENMLAMFVRNLGGFARGEPLEGLVDAQAGY